MYENTRKHYRVAQREIYEDPYEGMYVTKEDHHKYFATTAAMILLTFLGTIFLMLKKK